MATRKAATKKAASAKRSAKVGKVMHEFKEGELKTRGDRTVTNRKQAIAIALNEARESGEKIPPPPRKKSTAKKKTAAQKKSPPRKAPARKAATKKTAAKKRA